MTVLTGFLGSGKIFFRRIFCGRHFGRKRKTATRGISMEPGGQGSFQAVKLQRPARATVCSHSTRDMAAMVPSNPNESIAMLIAGVCPVVDRIRFSVVLTS